MWLYKMSCQSYLLLLRGGLPTAIMETSWRDCIYSAVAFSSNSFFLKRQRNEEKRLFARAEPRPTRSVASTAGSVGPLSLGISSHEGRKHSCTYAPQTGPCISALHIPKRLLASGI